MNPLITRWKDTPCINNRRKRRTIENWNHKRENKTKKKKIKDLIVKRDISVGSYALFASAKGPEILRGFGNQVVEELDDDSAL